MGEDVQRHYLVIDPRTGRDLFILHDDYSGTSVIALLLMYIPRLA